MVDQAADLISLFAMGPLTNRRRVDDGLKRQMTAYWVSKGLDLSSQIPKLVEMAHSRKLYGEPHRIDMKLNEVRRQQRRE